MDPHRPAREAPRAGGGWWLCAALLLALCVAAALASRTEWHELVYTPSVVLLATGFAVVSRRRRLQPAGAWATFSTGLLVLALGDVVYVTPRIDDLGATGVRVADLLYLSGTLLLVAGAVRIKGAHVGEGDDEARIDATSIGIVAGVALWQPLIAPRVSDADVPTLGRLVSAAYPVLDVVVVAMLVWLLLGSRRRVAAAFLLVAASSVFLAADLGYTWRLDRGTVDDPSMAWLDTLWVVAYALYLLAVSHPSASALEEPSPAEQHRTISGRRLALSGATLLTPVVALVAMGADPTSLALALGTEVALVVLVLVRISDLAEGERRAQRALLDKERYFRSLVQNASEAMVVVGPDGVVEDCSPAVRSLLGVPPVELVGARLVEAVPALDDVLVANVLDAAASAPGEVRTGEVPIPTDGVERWLELRTTNLLDDPAVAGLVVNLNDATARHQVQADLERRAFTDALTGLANRALFDDRLALLLTRRTPPDVAVVYCDLDGFKRVNDRFGHAEGDRLLRWCAQRLVTAVRREDTVARLGGDEFAVLLQGPDAAATAAEVGARIVEALGQRLEVGGATFEVSVSAGVAMAPAGSGVGARELMRSADEAMYRAKGAGGGRLVVLEGWPGDVGGAGSSAVPPRLAGRP
jgi:diguanylate cyclase (GGDEF)-like protein/PAS domain S-box-containing protein